MKKFHLIFFLPLFLLLAYLWLAHTYIYYTIGHAKLAASDNLYTYVLPGSNPTAAPLIYASIGDSLTAGVGLDRFNDSYPYLLAQHFSAAGNKITLKNFSYPGARTADVLNDLLSSAIAAQPDIVTVLIGTNDIHNLITTRAMFTMNYDHLLNRLTTETKAKIYLVSIPQLGSDSLLFFPYNYYFPYEVGQYNKIIIRLAEKYKVGYNDITTPTALLSKGASPYYSPDRFHPAAIGYKLWAQLLYDGIPR